MCILRSEGEEPARAVRAVSRTHGTRNPEIGTMHVEWLYSSNAEFRVSDYGDRQPLSLHRLGHTNVSANAGVGIPRTLHLRRIPERGDLVRPLGTNVRTGGPHATPLRRGGGRGSADHRRGDAAGHL